MTEASLLAENLRALEARDPGLAGRLRGTQPRRDIVFLPSRSGLPVPALRAGGRTAALHSLVDPLREGERLSGLHPGEGYCVALGLGGGYHLAALLARPEISRLLVVERDPALLRSVLARVDLRTLLGDARTRLLVAADFPRLKQAIVDSYLPAIEGRLRTVTLRSIFEADPGYYGGAVEAIRSLVARLAEDYTVQSRFGRLWYANILRNLARAQDRPPPLPRVRRALVTGAGPSLDGQMEALRRLRPGGTLIATDTSLPALLARGLVPDLVLSIDCQPAGFHHFLQGLPPGVLLVLDLASPPRLARLSRRPLFLAGGHPFCRWLEGAWMPFPRLDTSGGNVSHAAVSLADRLGAEEIHLFGMDFSCPNGRSYARGTYLYPLFEASADRFQPLEERFFSFLLRSPQLSREIIPGETGAGGPVPPGIRYGTPQLSGYRERLEELLQGVRARVIPAAGLGLPIRLPEAAQTPAAKAPGRAGDGPPAGAGFRPSGAAPSSGPSWRRALQSYLSALSALPEPRPPLGAWLDGLQPAERALWFTLLPAAAYFRERSAAAAPAGRRAAPGGVPLLLQVREWARGEILKALAQEPG